LSALTPTVELGAQWPPMGIEPVNPFELPLLNTVILLSSGATITYAHHALIKGERKGALYGSIFTVLLALIFTCFLNPEFTFFVICIMKYIVYILFISGSATYSLESIHTPGPVTGSTSFNRHLRRITTKTGKKFYSTVACAGQGLPAGNTNDSALPPYWVTGFTDGEGSFSLKVSKSISTRSGYNVTPEFKIELHNRDILILRKIHAFFGIGTINEYADRNKASYSVQSAKDMAKIIIPHFDKYPLLTQKQADFLLFKEAINLLLTGKARSSIEGIYELMNIKGSMNRMQSDKLILNFPNLKCVPRLVINTHEIKDLNWLAGFVDAEGYFYVKSLINSRYTTGYNITLVFSITQHARDEVLLTKFIDLLGCGKIEKSLSRPDAVNYRVNKFSDIKDKIIPFFQKYPLQGIKLRDYLDFVKASDIIAVKDHLTPEGIKKINSLRSGMNKSREIN
jgi:hypothetical protein